MKTVDIVILGAGFAGLSAAGECRRRFGARACITVIERSETFWFRPGFPLVLGGRVALADLAVPLEPLLTDAGIRWLRAEVTGLEPGSRQVITTRGAVVYDYLIIALGGSSPPADPSGLLEHGHAPIWPQSVRTLQRAAARCSGGEAVMVLAPFTPLPGPGYEILLEMVRSLRGRVRWTLITWEEHPYAFAGPRATRSVARRLAREGIRVWERAVVRKAEPGMLHLADGRNIRSDLTVVMPSFAGPPAFRDLPGLTDEGGFILVDRSLRTPLYPNIFAAGDGVSFPGPKSGLAAEIQGRIAARNIAGEFGLHRGETYRNGFFSLADLAGGGLLSVRLPGGSSRPHLLMQGTVLVWLKRAFQQYFLRVGLPLRLNLPLFRRGSLRPENRLR